MPQHVSLFVPWLVLYACTLLSSLLLMISSLLKRRGSVLSTMLLALLALACVGRVTWFAFQAGPIGQGASVSFPVFMATEVASLLLFGFCIACEFNVCVCRVLLLKEEFFSFFSWI